LIEYKDEDDRGEMRVETTEWFRTKKSLVKYIGIGVVGIFILYVLITIFGVYFFLSFFLYLVVVFIVFNKLYEAPGELFIECNLGSHKDKDSEGDVISIQRIPHQLLENFKSKGSNMQKLRTKTGQTISIVENINVVAQIIKYSWYAEESPFEFYAKKETFVELKKLVIKLMDDILKAKETRLIYHKMEIMGMLDDMERRKDMKLLEEEFREARSDK